MSNIQISRIELNEFQNIFSGNSKCFGQHIPQNKKDGKITGKNYTIKKELTANEYYQHLVGVKGLGVVPLTLEGTVKFIVIDVDNYQQDYVSHMIDKVYDNNLPFLPFFSKSGGLHLYLFLDQFYAYKKINYLIKEFLPVLGLENKVEIFPKQLKLKENEAGNWINLPYFAGNKTTRYMVSQDHKKISLAEALHIIKEKNISLEILEKKVNSLELIDAPPCLQRIFYMGITECRNEYLFSLTTYLKLKYDDNFEEELLNYNAALKEPLPTKEIINTIIKSHKKDSYGYKCKQAPLQGFCNKSICGKRKFGIGGEEISELSFEEFTQYRSDPPYYEWKINGKKLAFFSETEIINQQKFRELCFRELHVMPFRIKDMNWTKIINRALQNVIVKEIESAEDMSPGAMLMHHLYDFFHDRTRAENLSQILIDRVYFDEEQKQLIFRGPDLINYIHNQKNFRYFRTTEIQNRLRKLGAINKRIYIDKKNDTVRVWAMSFDVFNGFRIDHSVNKPLDFSKIQKEEY